MENKNFNKRAIMVYAWSLVRTQGFTLSDALKCAWANAKFNKVAKEHVCEFVYMKVDGTIRKAIGTITATYTNTSGVYRAQNPDIQKYFDIECGAWRSFRKQNLIRVIR